MATPTVYEQNLAKLSSDLGMSSLTAPQLSSQPLSNIWGWKDPSSSLSTSMEVPSNLGLSGEASRPLGNGSAQNSTQRATQKKSDIQSAFDGVQSLYSPTGGRPIAGSEDIKVKSDVYGRPYTVVDTSPRSGTDIYGSTYTMQGGKKVYDAPTEKQKEDAEYSARQLKEDLASGKQLPAGEEERRKGMVMHALGQTGRVKQESRDNLLSKYLK